ncbi:DUF6286 domain-containing protein [Corynebacterium caspium]|uniref:DUF6286 domain-containing protein n=1 Tax=Corynebacterium caspium TaxID=234828 RepID=UPI000361EE56|nr:DUF6286 domain-containing protein [Corynebacterium caspium]WKD59852.1 hypothetical protein CCASP_07365 [Corynebacterium caspium DSM 44850]
MSTEKSTPQLLAPTRSPAVRFWAILLGLALIGLAIIAGREIILRGDPNLGWPSWVDPIAAELAANSYQPWMTTAAIIAVIIGIILLIVAALPGTSRYIQLTSPNTDTSIWARPIDLARSITANAKLVPGVQAATTTVRKNRIKLTVKAEATADSAKVEQRLAEKFNANLEELLIAEIPLEITVEQPEIAASQHVPEVHND